MREQVVVHEKHLFHFANISVLLIVWKYSFYFHHITAQLKSRGSDDHVKWRSLSPVGDVKIVSSIGTFVLNTLTLKQSALFT